MSSRVYGVGGSGRWCWMVAEEGEQREVKKTHREVELVVGSRELRCEWEGEGG